VGAHRNTPRRNLDFSNLCSKTSIFRIWAKFSACSDAHPTNLRPHLYTFNYLLQMEMWSQILCSTPTARWRSTFPSRVNLHHMIDFGNLCGANLVAYRPKIWGRETLELYRVDRGCLTWEVKCLGIFRINFLVKCPGRTVKVFARDTLWPCWHQ